jgi:hypothetical protein
MLSYHTRLALEYFQARPRNERSPGILRGIVTHVCLRYALSAEATQAVQAEALREAQRRGFFNQQQR